MKQTVKSLIAKLTNLNAEEERLQRRLQEVRHEQATILSSLQVKPRAREATRKKSAATATKQPTATAVTVSPAAATPAVRAKPDAERVREYIGTLPENASITTDGVASKLG